MVIMEINLHGMELVTAEAEVLLTLQESELEGDCTLSVIHGFHSGETLKRFFNSDQFLKKMVKQGYRLTVMRSSNPGTTNYNVEFLKK
jgi:DNA-nicking Smr family endonuclease